MKTPCIWRRSQDRGIPEWRARRPAQDELICPKRALKIGDVVSLTYFMVWASRRKEGFNEYQSGAQDNGPHRLQVTRLCTDGQIDTPTIILGTWQNAVESLLHTDSSSSNGCTYSVNRNERVGLSISIIVGKARRYLYSGCEGRYLHGRLMILN